MVRRGNNFHRIDISVTHWMAENGIRLLRISIGMIFLWFGLLKFFSGASPAESLAISTIRILTFGIPGDELIIRTLAVWETLIGLGLILRVYLRETLFLLYLQMAGTLTPLFLFPEETFVRFPFVLSLEGQYIIKNLVVISAGIVIGATVRGGRLVAESRK